MARCSHTCALLNIVRASRQTLTLFYPTEASIRLSVLSGIGVDWIKQKITCGKQVKKIRDRIFRICAQSISILRGRADDKQIVISIDIGWIASGCNENFSPRLVLKPWLYRLGKPPHNGDAYGKSVPLTVRSWMSGVGIFHQSDGLAPVKHLLLKSKQRAGGIAWTSEYHIIVLVN